MWTEHRKHLMVLGNYQVVNVCVVHYSCQQGLQTEDEEQAKYCETIVKEACSQLETKVKFVGLRLRELGLLTSTVFLY